MEKRKFKINVVDIAIFIVIICSVAMLVFRGEISDKFGKTEIVAFEITVSADSVSPNSKALFKTGTELVLRPSDEDESIRAVVIDSEFFSSGKAELLITCNGYEKLAKHYTESGTELFVGGECEIILGDMILHCNIEKINIKADDM